MRRQYKTTIKQQFNEHTSQSVISIGIPLFYFLGYHVDRSRFLMTQRKVAGAIIVILGNLVMFQTVQFDLAAPQ